MIHAGWHWRIVLSRSFALITLPIAITSYLVTWTGWFLTQGWGYRKADVLASFIDFHQQMYRFHSTLQTPHPYEASPLTWLGMLRPTSFYYEESGSDVVAINPLGNPIFWAAGIVALGFLFSWFATNRDRLSLLVFSGYVAGYLPWVIYSERTAFQFYSATFAPWIFLTITLMAFRYKLRRVVAIGAVLAFLLFLYFLPLYLGLEIPFWFWASHMWLPTWV
jgi:dolichyl-phosphate-mannose--protein O-mannosyl transferase